MAAILGGLASALLPMIAGKIFGKGKSTHMHPALITLKRRRRRRKLSGKGHHVMTIMRHPTIAFTTRGRGIRMRRQRRKR